MTHFPAQITVFGGKTYKMSTRRQVDVDVDLNGIIRRVKDKYHSLSNIID